MRVPQFSFFSSSDNLGILAPVLPQNESGSVLSQNMVLPQDEVYRTDLPLHEVGSVLQNGMFEIILLQIETDKTVLHQSNIVTVNCQWLNGMKIALNFMSNIGDKITKNLTSAVTHGAEKLAWTIRIVLECLQHILKMYAWSLSKNQASVKFKCRLIALMLKQSLFRTHDFAVWVYQIYHDYQNPCVWQLKNYLNISSVHTKEEYSDKSTGFHYYGGGKALIFSSD